MLRSEYLLIFSNPRGGTPKAEERREFLFIYWMDVIKGFAPFSSHKWLFHPWTLTISIASHVIVSCLSLYSSLHLLHLVSWKKTWPKWPLICATKPFWITEWKVYTDLLEVWWMHRYNQLCRGIGSPSNGRPKWSLCLLQVYLFSLFFFPFIKRTWNHWTVEEIK